MSLQRYEHYYAGMDETPDGEYVLLADVVQLLVTKHNPEYWTHSTRCPICKAIALITGEADYYAEEAAWAESIFKGESKSVTRRKKIENGEQL